jgi:hypothetical protein
MAKTTAAAIAEGLNTGATPRLTRAEKAQRKANEDVARAKALDACAEATKALRGRDYRDAVDRLQVAIEQTYAAIEASKG